MIDTGEWSLCGDFKNLYIQSDDFRHDVIFRIDGDFGSDKDKLEYLKDIISRLNKTRGR